MCGDTADAFAMDPLGSLEIQVVRSNVLDQDGLSGTANDPDNVRVEGEAPKWTIEERPVLFLWMDWSPGARDQMKTPRAIAALVALEAGIADVAGQEQPDPRQGDTGLRRKASNDGLQHVLQIALRRHGHCETQKPVIFHQETCQADVGY